MQVILRSVPNAILLFAVSNGACGYLLRETTALIGIQNQNSNTKLITSHENYALGGTGRP